MFWDFLKSNKASSSLRVNMFLVTLAFLPILLAIAFYIGWWAFKFKEIEWTALSLFIGSCGGFLYTLWYAKERNKRVEKEIGETSTKEES